MDNIDLEYASLRGLLVLNAPESNNVSAAELAVMHLMAAARGIIDIVNENMFGALRMISVQQGFLTYLKGQN